MHLEHGLIQKVLFHYAPSTRTGNALVQAFIDIPELPVNILTNRIFWFVWFSSFFFESIKLGFFSPKSQEKAVFFHFSVTLLMFAKRILDG